MENIEDDELYTRFLKTNPHAYKSRKHHYIPVFYLNGFADSRGKFYLYDKQKDTIRESSPRSSFYEWDRNTLVNPNGEKSSFIEDFAYKAIDDMCAGSISNFRNLPNTDELYNYENVAGITWFILNLYIRNPKYDKVFDDFLQRSKITLLDRKGNICTDIELIKLYNEDKQMRKVHKLALASEAVKEFDSNRNGGSKLVKLVTFSYDAFICCDFPIIYFATPATLQSIVQQEYFLPISSKRIYYTASNCSLDWDIKKVLLTNALLIEQATKYVCSPNKSHLEDCVKYYRFLKERGLLEQTILTLWNT